MSAREWHRLAQWVCAVCEKRYDTSEEAKVNSDIGFMDQMVRLHMPSFPHVRYSRNSTQTNILELGWMSQIAIGATAQERQAFRLNPPPVREINEIRRWGRSDHSLRSFRSLAHLTECEKQCVFELERNPDPARLQEAAHVFLWFNYILARVGDVYDIPAVPLPLAATHPALKRARELLDTKLREVMPDLAYEAARGLLDGIYRRIASHWQYERQHPEDIGFVVQSKILETQLEESKGDRDEYISQYNLDLRKDADKLSDRCREQWLLALFAYKFDQSISRAGNTIHFLTHYVVHWSDWGTAKAHAILNGRKRMGRRILPVLLHLGIGHWVVWDPFTTQTRYVVSDVVHAIALWQWVVALPPYHNTLENGRQLPDLGWGIAALARDFLDARDPSEDEQRQDHRAHSPAVVDNVQAMEVEIAEQLLRDEMKHG